MKNIFALLMLSLFIIGCSNDSVDDSNDSVVVQDTSDENNSDNIKVGEMEYIETLFDEISFSNPEHYELLKELDICDSMYIEGSPCAACAPQNFAIFPFKNNTDLSNAFMVQVKAMTVLKGQSTALPMRHLIVFERENGSLVKVNGFRGNLIAKRESGTGVKDLIIRFYVPDEQTFFNCLFEWNTEESQYDFKSVEAIDWGEGTKPVKASMRDSISNDIYQTLMSNAMIF